MRNKIVSLVQFAIGVALIAFLFATMKDRGDLLEAVRDAASHWGFLVAGASSFLICLVVCTARWRILLDAQGLSLSFPRAMTLYFVGHFFNSFLFGVTGGDVVKAYYAARETQHRKTEAVSTIFLDRIVGLLALVLLVVILMLCRLPFFLRHTETRLALAFFSVVLVGAIGGLTLVFRQNLMDRWSVTRRLRENSKIGAIIGRVYDAFQLALTHRGLLAKTMGLSLINHFAFVLCTGLLGVALELELTPLDYLTTIPIINAVAAIPITPGGLGTREATSRMLLGTLGVAAPRAVLLSLLTYGLILFWSLVGGVVYSVYALRMGKAPAPDEI